MKLGESFDSAVRAVVANKLRSALTMLGVVIGVGSVIAMIGIGEGTKAKSIEQLEVRGTTMISVVPDWGRRRNAGDASTLRVDDVQRIDRQVPSVSAITGIVRAGGVTAKQGSNFMRGDVWGAEPQIKVIASATDMLQGDWFTAEHEMNVDRVAVLGFQAYQDLFGEGGPRGRDDGPTAEATANAVGATIRLNDQNFEVLGVVDFKGGSGWSNPDERIYIPLTTAQQRLTGQTDRFDFIAANAMSSEFINVTKHQIEETLAQTRRSASGEELFRVFDQAEDLAAIEEQSRLLSMLLAGIASVSLLVGGIGIMNIMLVSVTERTREIGLRKAIGAKRGAILAQFLLESVVMCVFGGAIGIVLGQIATGFVADALQVPRIISTQAIGMAVVFSTTVGVFFGLYPAIRASKLQPIEALRYE